MSSFNSVLLEEGVELELPVDFPEVISVLEREVSDFSCEGYVYRLDTAGRQLMTRWELSFNLADEATHQMVPAPVGYIQLEMMDEGKVRFRIPPRVGQDDPAVTELDPDGRFYSSFIYQLLNAFQRNKLIDLPGTLPVV